MKSLIAIVTAAAFLCCSTSETAQNDARMRAWLSMTEQQRFEAPIEYKAAACGYTISEFDLLSRTIEAESDRTNNFEGRVLICLVILNRVNDNSGRFPNDIENVINQPGQFSVVASGAIWSVGRTNLSDAAIFEARRRITAGTAPNVLFFNNSCFQYGDAYCVEGGNYFVTN